MYQRLNRLIDTAQKGYREYNFGATYQALHHFCSIDLSAFYMDVAKDALYCDHKNDVHRRAMQTVLYDSLVTLTKLLTPITPYTAEEAWSFIEDTNEAFVQLSDMPSRFEVEGEATGKRAGMSFCKCVPSC